jgi:GntR family transcriptional regulator/MocR family aminotransferase
MGKRASFQDLSLAPPQDGEALWSWLYRALRAAMLDGRLKPGSRMPSTRNLAQQYRVARGTVVAVFNHLRREGYLDTQVGAGTFVASMLPDESMTTAQRPAHLQRGGSQAHLSHRGRRAAADVVVLPPSHSMGKAFRSYEPAIDLFPVALWSRVAGRVLRRAPRSLYGQGDARGYMPLRRAIAAYLGAARGVHCSAEQVLITAGAQQALDLATRMLLDPGDTVWVEDPGYPGAVGTLQAGGAQIVPIPVDHHGLNVEWARRQAPPAKLAYVTPANQFPLGVAMSLERRLALLHWASATDAWIIEDEYDAEYRYGGRPLAALQSLDRAGCVIYIGTFTKMLFNALRLGFLVLPARLVEAFTAARSVIDRHPPTLEQAILAEFIMEGHFGHHVRRMRQTYAERMAVLADSAQRQLCGGLDVVPAVAGMRTVGWLQTNEPDVAVAERGHGRGLELAAVSQFALRYPPRDGLILGFAGCNAAELQRGVDVLAAVLSDSAAKGTRGAF